MAKTQLTTSSYAALDEDTQAFLSKKTGEIKTRMQRSALDVLGIGAALLEVKTRLKHGLFQQWIESEFSMSDRTARRFMAVAERFGGKTDTVTVLPVSVLYLLSSGKVSDEEAEQVISGEIPVSSLRQKPRREEQEEAEKSAVEYAVEGTIAFYNALQVGATEDELIQAVQAVLLTFDEEGTDVREALSAAGQAILDAIEDS